MSIYLFQIINGIGLGMIYFLIAVGLSITLGLLGFVNFAHGAFYLLGAYLTYQVAAVTGSFLLAAIVVPIAIGLLAFLLERGLLRHTYGMPHKYQIVATFGVVLIVQELVIIVWGPLGHGVSVPEVLSGIVNFSAIGGSSMRSQYRGAAGPTGRVARCKLSVPPRMWRWYPMEAGKLGSGYEWDSTASLVITSILLTIHRPLAMHRGMVCACKARDFPVVSLALSGCCGPLVRGSRIMGLGSKCKHAD